MWFMHDAHLRRAFLVLDTLAEYTLLSMTVTVTPCLWYVVGMKLVMSHVKFPQAPFARAPFGECQKKEANRNLNPRNSGKIIPVGGGEFRQFCCAEPWEILG